MTILLTPNQSVAYIDPATPLRDLAEASRLVAENVDAALMRGGFTPTPGYPRGRVKKGTRTTTLSLIANASGTGSQTPNSAQFEMVSLTASLAPGRQYNLKLIAPQIGGVANDRARVSLYARGAPLMNSYMSLWPNGTAVTLEADFTVPANDPAVSCSATLCRDVGAGAFFAFGDTASPIRLTVEDVGAA